MIHFDTFHKILSFTSFKCLLYLFFFIPDFLFSLGSLYCDCCLPALLLLGVLLLGADRGVAVLPGCHRQNEVTTHSQALSVPRLGWASTGNSSHFRKYVCSVKCGTYFWFSISFKACSHNAHLCDRFSSKIGDTGTTKKASLQASVR